MCHKSPFILHLKSPYLPFSFHGFPYLQCHLIIFQQDLLPHCPSALPFQGSINATTPSQELLLCHFDVRHLGIQDFFTQVQTENKNTWFGGVTDPDFKWKRPEQGWWGEGLANKTWTPVVVECWDPVVICPAAGHGELLLALGTCRHCPASSLC